jgi:hypothetical protein
LRSAQLNFAMQAKFNSLDWLCKGHVLPQFKQFEGGWPEYLSGLPTKQEIRASMKQVTRCRLSAHGLQVELGSAGGSTSCGQTESVVGVRREAMVGMLMMSST